jgi:hypothetical protein
VAAGDFRRIRPSVRTFGSVETVHRIAKSRYRWPFLPLSPLFSPTLALLGWRHSADRTFLRVNSLLSGNFVYFEHSLASRPNSGRPRHEVETRPRTAQRLRLPDHHGPGNRRWPGWRTLVLVNHYPARRGLEWSAAHVSPRHHRDLLARPKRRRLRRPRDS